MKVLDLQSDLKSSIVVFLVALPLCLGIALASNAPLASGLVAGIIGGIVIGFTSNSQVSVSGPAAGLTVIVASGIHQLGGFENFGIAVLLAGLLQIAFGLVKGGAIGNYFPSAVIKGMLAAIGLILIIKQFPNIYIPHNLGVGIVAVFSLSIILIWEHYSAKKNRFFQLIPGPLAAVFLSIMFNQIFHLAEGEYLVQLPESIFSGFSFPQFQNINSTVFQVAASIAIVASLETLLCIDAADKIDPLKRTTNKNRELMAQGIGNSFSGLVGGLPLTAVIVRTSANIAGGARTKRSAIFHGVWLLVCVLLIPGVLNLIPLATLATVLILVGYKLTKPAFFIDMYKRGWEQLLIYCVTISAIIMTDLLKGIFVGFVVAVIFELKKPALSCLEIKEEGNEIHLKFIRNVSFLHKAKIHKLLNDLPAEKQIQIHGMKLVRVHVDVHEFIMEYYREAQKKGREISLV